MINIAGARLGFERLLPSCWSSRFEFKSIKTKLTFILVTMLIITGTILTGIAAFMAADSLNNAEIEKLHAVGMSSSEKLWLVANMGKDIASILSVDPEIVSVLLDTKDGTLTPDRQQAVSDHLITIEDSFSDIFDRINVLDNQGIVIASTHKPHIGEDFSGREVFINQQREAYVGEPYLGLAPYDIPRIPYARPVFDGNGQQIGLVYVALILPTIDKHLFSTPYLSDDSTNFLVGPDGTIFSGIEGDYSPFLKEKFDLSIFPAGATMARATGYFGYPEYIVKNSVPGTTWSVITSESVNAVNDTIMNLIMLMVLSLIIVIALGVVVTTFIANGLTRPIQALTDNARQLALGDADVVITHTGIDELGQLADSFRRILQSACQLMLALKGARGGLWTWDTRNNLFTLTSEFASHYHSLHKEQSMDSFISSIHPDEREQYLNILLETTKNAPDAGIEYEFRLQSTEGMWCWIMSRGIVSDVDANGCPLLVTGTFMDVTERKQYENYLRETNRKMHILSQLTRHDTMNQLTNMFTISELISDEISDVYVKKLFKRMEKSLSRVRSLMEFSKGYLELGIHGAAWQNVNVCIEKGKSLLIHPPIELLADNLPMVFADPLLGDVVYNLIENSTRHGEHVTEIKITFSVDDENNGVLTFKDNGIGVPDEEKEKIFDMSFGKNTGLGLFLIREILELTDIKIRECGQFGQGAQFDVIIPSGYWKW